MHRASAHDHRRAGDRRHGVKLRAPQYGWHLVHEEVANDPAADAGHHAEQYRRNWRQVKGKRLQRATHCKEREPRGVEKQNDAPQPIGDARPLGEA